MSAKALHTNKRFFWKWGIGLLVFLCLAYVFSNIVFYLIISLIISTLLRPFVSYVSELYIFDVKVPRMLAVILAFVLLILILSIFFTLLVPLIYDQMKLLSELDYGVVQKRFTMPIQNLEDFIIQKFKINIKKGYLIDELSKKGFSLLEHLQVGTLINNLFALMAELFVALLALTFITFFLLYEKGIIRNRIIEIIPNQYFEVIITTIFKIERLLSSYLLGIMLESLMIFGIISLGLSIFGIKYSVTIAVFVALINFIPYIGPFAGYLLGLFVGISASFEGADINILLIKITVVFMIARLIDDLILQPLIFSKSVKAHPLEIFLAIFAGATLGGPVGMILAVPSYTILRVIYTEFYKGYRQYHIFNR